MNGGNDYSLLVGESAKVKTILFGNISVVYAGMVSEQVYSVVVKWTSGNNSLAYNLYLRKTQKQVHLPKGEIIVSSVTPERMNFRYVAAG
ncbi:MAG: hypothetical protein R3178_10570 [Rhodothermales bacterium]|nr:hypothetical protein [Rhodothermales bacterium]